MSELAPGTGHAPHQANTRTAVLAVLVTAGLHCLCTTATALPGVLAPIAARDFDLPPGKVGIMQALHYGTTVFTGLIAAPLLARLGPTRMLQVAALTTGLAALSCALAGWLAAGAAPTPNVWLFGIWLVATGILFGTGYGLLVPVSSNVIFAATPLNKRSLAFSIKQTSVPVGFGIAGLCFPPLLGVMSWQWVACVMFFVLAASVIGLAPLRLATQDVSVNRRELLRWSDFSGPLRDVFAERLWRERALLAVVYTGTQTAVSAYMVSFLNLEIELSMIAAGGVFAVAQIGGVLGRVMLGASADRWLNPRLQLAMVGFATTLFGLTLASITPAWPLALVGVVCVLLCIASYAWNGVFIAETATLAPPGKIGHFTGGMQVFIALGATLGPAVYALILSLGASYSFAYLLLSLPPSLVALRILRSAPARGAR